MKNKALIKLFVIMLCAVLLSAGAGCSKDTAVTPTNLQPEVVYSIESDASDSPSANSSPASTPEKQTASKPPAKETPDKVTKHLTQITCNYADREDKQVVFKYNNQVITAIEHTNSANHYTYEETLTYNKNGNLLLKIAGTPIDEVKPGENVGCQYTYNEKGLLIQEFSWGGGEYTLTHSYNSAGKRIRSVGLGDGWKDTTTYEYNSQGVLTNAIFTGKHETDNTHKVQNLHYDTVSYKPFTVVTTYENNKFMWSTLQLWNQDGAVLLDPFSLNNPQYFWDADGYLAKIKDLDTGDLYEFYYNGKKAVPHTQTK